ncbi:hypothetical protein LG634_32310 [Streptomyces bambusae]|uniref:hypothetical protein n=1 Tax=Streptomyces bambusae TaxID=1550616 RepID=UPI001CFFC317|nr:hypothetical protein [Streptomyces bambusae]MCB5169478.1 hypothetical protein [Streptomyces bambusae]
MKRLALVAAGVAGLSALAIAPAGAATAAASGASETVTTCSPSRLQAGLSTKVCADITGTTVEVYGKVSLAGPPSPGSPAPSPKDLMTTLTSEVVGVSAPQTQNNRVVFIASPVEVRGVTSTASCGATVRGTFSVATFPWYPNPVTQDFVVPC